MTSMKGQFCKFSNVNNVENKPRQIANDLFYRIGYERTIKFIPSTRVKLLFTLKSQDRIARSGELPLSDL